MPPRSTLHNYFDLRSWNRTLDLISHALYGKFREAIGRGASPTAIVIDSQNVARKIGSSIIRRVAKWDRSDKEDVALR